MDKKEYGKAMEEAMMKQTLEAPYPMWRRAHWDEWGSPVGLTLAWAPGLVCVGIFLWFLHLAELI
ncbi:MAG: hypothetical protein WCI57_02190 [Candidatus Berkelbacteria bacterium]